MKKPATNIATLISASYLDKSVICTGKVLTTVSWTTSLKSVCELVYGSPKSGLERWYSSLIHFEIFWLNSSNCFFSYLKTEFLFVLFTIYLFLFLQFSESVNDLSGTKFEEDHLSHYSPWSCGTIGSCINAIDSEPKDVIANSNAVLMVGVFCMLPH